MTAELSERSPEIHHSHRDVTGGWLRPATFGVMDGLVSNFALVAGVVGGGASGKVVLMTGLAGLVAGACSMASGEFTSVSSQAELMQAEIAVEKRELEIHPAEEERELALMYEAKGLRPELAAEVARELTADPEVALDVHVREELGVDPNDLPSPWVAAGSSFAAFAIGALIPLIPFVFGVGSILPALLLSALGLVITGGIVGKITARPFWYGGGRQLLLGGLSAAVTFAIGLAVGTGLS
ncbi:VIT1/CCC1 transporter family protein [Kribbella solani]|uniref:VIT1/CCC1 family predicted Fe2+/Mn2+ transporter n=1 Tax=Kribbella solani TaxID=236067 RepID=A0A841DV20_9ACTN|nr:VIT1/CCC1 transporter family protein [Kribbella solani]MBB5982462.1 VIT1/CCC1 family predicted Fe2+/Mn2+ transporter [Kribbella solani]MDX2974380.1 VIT1/CCC1 transporter family protein [Kribbella solani]MDX3006759.1 VIT1/CCC1 transporter family protein [Kribbella solani]